MYQKTTNVIERTKIRDKGHHQANHDDTSTTDISTRICTVSLNETSGTHEITDESVLYMPNSSANRYLVDDESSSCVFATSLSDPKHVISKSKRRLQKNRAFFQLRHRFYIRKSFFFKAAIIAFLVVLSIFLILIIRSVNNNNKELRTHGYEKAKISRLRDQTSDKLHSFTANPHGINLHVLQKNINFPLPVHQNYEKVQLPLPPPEASPISIETNKSEENNVKSGSVIRTDIEEYSHRHVIPNIIIFTHYINLLSPTFQSDTESKELTTEDHVLALNVQNTISFHDTAKVYFLTDKECIQSIENMFQADSVKATSLIHHFENEAKGMYKADLCRGAALYETGGLYFDVDIQARMSIWKVLNEMTEFVTVKNHPQSNHPTGFFQAFIGVTKGHPIMKTYVEYFLEYYEEKRKVDGPLGVMLLREAFEDYYHGGSQQKIEKTKDDEHLDFNVQDENEYHSEELKEVELWQEVRYNPNLFPGVKPPVGKRRACHFMVAIPWKLGVAPFYSRVKGSRMCGGKDSNK